MNPILESQEGDDLICLASFSASSEGQDFSWETCRTFRIGERVRFAGFFQDPHFQGRPNGWMVRFLADDGKHYVATQTYFMTLDGWKDLKRFFARRLLREPARRRSSSSGRGDSQS